MHIIENFKILLNTDIAWADGPAWLLGMMLAWAVMGIAAACVTR